MPSDHVFKLFGSQKMKSDMTPNQAGNQIFICFVGLHHKAI